MEQSGGNSNGDAGQLVALVFQQNLGGLLNSLLTEIASGHLMQQGNVSDNLLGMFVFAGHGHGAPPQLDNMAPDLSSQKRQRS
jgi:hypothetical protein